MALLGLLEILVAVTCFVILRCLCSKNKTPTNWPLVGMLPGLLLNVHRIHDWCAEILELTGCTFVLKGPWLGNMDILVTVHPDNVHYIMSTNFSNFPKGSDFNKMFDILGDGIFNSDYDLWKNQRKTARLFLNHQEFYHFLVNSSQIKVQNGLIPVMENVVKNGLVLDLQDLFQRFTFDATCLLTTGYDPQCLSIELPKVPFSMTMDTAEEAIFYRHVVPESIWKLQRLVGIGEEKRLTQAWKTLDDIIAEIISMKKDKLSKATNSDKQGYLSEGRGADSEGIDLLTKYMTENGIAESESNEKFLRDTIINFMIAGRDTTSAGLTWFMWQISRNPQVKNKIREELEAVIPTSEAKKWRLFSVEELRNSVYLQATLCETLRLYPPVPFQHKSPLQPDILPSGHRVHPKTKIIFSLYSMGRMSSIWGKDCLEFKPERWISERGGVKHEPSYKFMVFNAGPRTCLGKEVAFTQMKLVAAAIVYNYDIEVVEADSVIPATSIILHMKHGLKVKVSKRWA
ncbi:Cytochrome P450 [Tripterygium wilfordii]|uniref:Cytochrome P450 n=1 Tax=Tripterygium wilfordii TaxID=458696 RepID=A0A7J7CQC2_TRIWF|nr:alkane hydroxylase MAH1-like [Tripterygium wilfordii]KAF5736280.1 Cytochrome P450 [Tripterygium wilfordii]